MVLKGSLSLWLGILGLFIGTYLEEKQTSHILRIESTFANWCKASSGIMLLLSHKNWGIGESAPWMFVFQRGNF